MQKRIGLAFAALVLAGGGAALSVGQHTPDGASAPAVEGPATGTTGQIQAPPPPPRTKPIERVVTAAPN